MPVLADLTIGGQPRKVVMVANRNGFFYVLDRVTGKLLVGKPFTDTTWARELGPDGHPIVLNDGSKGCLPDQWGSTNFMPPSFDPALRAVLRHRARDVRDLPAGRNRRSSPGRTSISGTVRRDPDKLRRAARDRPDDGRAQVGVQVSHADLGGRDVDGVGRRVRAATTKATSWPSTRAPARISGTTRPARRSGAAAPMTFMLDGRQHVIIGSGTTITAFALPAN